MPFIVMSKKEQNYYWKGQKEANEHDLENIQNKFRANRVQGTEALVDGFKNIQVAPYNAGKHQVNRHT